MSLRRQQILDRGVQVSDATTFVQALPRSGILSAISLRAEITNGATRGTERVFEAIDRIEVIVNGSEVVYSLEGVEAYKWQYVLLKRRPPHIWTEVNAAVQELTFIIPFGRKLGDPELALDLSRYNSCELRITYSPTISATTFVTGTTTFTVIGHFWRDGTYSGAPRGYIRTSQIQAFVSAAAGEQPQELPRRFPLLDLLIHVREAAGTNPDDNITLAEIREDSGLVVPYKGRFLDIAAENAQRLDLDPEEFGIALVQDADTFDTHQTRALGVQLSPVFVQSDANGIVTLAIGSVSTDRILISASELADAAATTHFTAYASRRQVHWRSRGFGLPQALWLPLWDGEDLNTAYPAPSKDRVDLVLTQGNAGATVRSSLRELVAA